MSQNKRARGILGSNDAQSPLQRRAATNPLWVFFVVGCLTPFGLIVYAVRQRTKEYVAILVILFGFLFFASDDDGETNQILRYSSQLVSGALAALVAMDNKKNALTKLNPGNNASVDSKHGDNSTQGSKYTQREAGEKPENTELDELMNHAQQSISKLNDE